MNIQKIAFFALVVFASIRNTNALAALKAGNSDSMVHSRESIARAARILIQMKYDNMQMPLPTAKKVPVSKLKEHGKRKTKKPYEKKIQASAKKSKKYKCTRCNHEATDKGNIRRHCFTHLDKSLQPYSCMVCPELMYTGFSHNNMRHHFSSKHPDCIMKRWVFCDNKKQTTIAQIMPFLYVKKE